jgi:UDP-N-acetylglucosamine transferase subunit ALG13
MPFDRLVRAVDAWAGGHPAVPVFAQIGHTEYVPDHLEWTAFMEPAAYRRMMFKADLVVAHAGMGTIITALELSRPLLVLPRHADLRETRNDHQVSTARRFAGRRAITFAADEHALGGHLDNWSTLAAGQRVGSHASFDLLDTVRSFITDGAVQPVADDDFAPALPLVMPAPQRTLETEERLAA